MEKKLPYRRDRLGQDTGSFCGPASEQTILSGHGLHVDEQTLARELGTDDDGTDYVGLIEKSLSKRLGVPYTSVYLSQDPPTGAQVETLWTHLRRSIDAGYGVVMNWVAPPSNYPRGVKGSASPSYGGGTVKHYVAAMGYDDVARAVWIVDSGFWPREYWVSLAQCASLIPPKGYAYAAVPAAPAPKPPAPASAGKPLGEVRGELFPRLGARLWNDAPNTAQAIIVHDTEGGYEGAIGWMESQRAGSYQTVVSLDGRETRIAPDDRQAWAAMSTGNRIGLHVSIEGKAAWSRAEWLAKGSGGLERMARRLAAWHREKGVPLVRITPADLRAGRRGVATHADVSAAWGETDHTDPGTGFPLDLVIARARELVNPTSGGFLMAISDAEQRELLGKVRYLYDQFGPGFDAWGEDGDLGRNAKGERRTLRAGLAALLRKASGA